jgi:hypothetical protein
LNIDFKEAVPGEVQKMEWPAWFLPLWDPRSKPGVDYLASRGLNIHDGVYYDGDSQGIVFPYFYDQVFVGAQIRFIEPRKFPDGSVQKIDTLPGSRLGLLFWQYNQTFIPSGVKNIVITEGAINAMSLQQAFQKTVSKELCSQFLFISTSGCNMSTHHVEAMKELKDRGYKVILAYDSDEAGIISLDKIKSKECVSHFSLSMDDELDWNDILIKKGPNVLVKTFLSNIRSIS